MSMVHNRFQVCDDICGIVEAVMTLREAIHIAKRHDTQHVSNGDPVRVLIYDAMARKDRPDTYDHTGYPTQREKA